jgi:ABC-type dipeptide/oligopeptide/nickel transport system permease component
MFAFIVRRLLWLPLLLVLVSIVTFALGVYGPGDPVQVMVGLHTNPSIIDRVRHEYGFDQPFYVQYLNYIWNALHGNFGYSLVKFQGQSVGGLIAARLPVTFELNFVSILWSVPLGIVLGVVAAVKRSSWTDLLVRAVVIGGISLPIILLLPFLTFVVSRKHELGVLDLGPFLPVGGWNGIFSDKIIMPALLEGLGPLAVFARQTRAGMIEALGQDYVRTARAKGLTERLVVYRHALRNALIPLVTIVGFLLGSLVEGSFLVEQWYGIPGIGAFAFDSLLSRDYYVVMAITLLIAIAYALANMLVDVAYVFVDPRIRYE